MAVKPGLNSVYLGLRPVPPELGPRAYRKGEQASSWWGGWGLGRGAGRSTRVSACSSGYARRALPVAASHFQLWALALSATTRCETLSFPCRLFSVSCMWDFFCISVLFIHTVRGKVVLCMKNVFSLPLLHLSCVDLLPCVS